MTGSLPQCLPGTIDRKVLDNWVSRGKGRFDVLHFLEGGSNGCTGPIYGGKYAAISMIGWANGFSGIILPTFIQERIFHGVVWYVLSDDAESWEQVQSHCVIKSDSPDEPKFGLKFKQANLLKGIVSPWLLMYDGSLCVEDYGHRPILGTWHGDEQDMETLMGVEMDRPLSGWLPEGEVVIPLMPKHPDIWWELRVKSGKLSETFAQQFEAERFALDPKDFLSLVTEHQKACNRFVYALWAVNWA